MDKQNTYQQLEENFLSYKQLTTVSVEENNDPLVDVANYGLTFCLYDTNVAASTGARIYVRQGLIDRLQQAQQYLSQNRPGYLLQLFYGYRDPRIQKATFDTVRQDMGLADDKSEAALEKIHRYIAVPDVAGHPTGGAVDILILDQDAQALDMGTAPHEFSPDSYVFSPFISAAAQNNRKLLRDAMMSAGFAPFDGEWWHFSYGDREWAAYYKKSAALYGNAERPHILGFEAD
ncbi:MAG: D-alanyl-D-alanine carboxypeptidase family protein [Alphaproteobacteria bacterium]|nr:D-alanyl-D-alanine carboxypeptidase family protein [Alphaproteobacteria bacterium]